MPRHTFVVFFLFCPTNEPPSVRLLRVSLNTILILNTKFGASFQREERETWGERQKTTTSPAGGCPVTLFHTLISHFFASGRPVLGVLQALAGDSGARGTTGSNTQPHRLGRVYHFRSTGTNPPPAARRTRLASQAVDAWYNALDWKLIRSTRARESRRASHSVRKRARRIAKRRQSSAPRRGRQDDKVISCRSEALWSSSSPSHTHSCTGRTYPLWPPP